MEGKSSRLAEAAVSVSALLKRVNFIVYQHNGRALNAERRMSHQMGAGR